MLIPDSTGVIPPSAATYGVPPVDVTDLYQPTPDYLVLGLSQETRIRPTDQAIVPTIAVSFRVPGTTGVFTIRIDNYAFTHADVLEYMRQRAWVIRSLYAIPGTLPPYVPQTSSTQTVMDLLGQVAIPPVP